MHYLRNNKTGKFVSGLLQSIQYGVPCRFITDGNVVLKNMASTYGIDMDDFSVLPATTTPRATPHQPRVPTMPLKSFLVDDCTKLENTGVTPDGRVVWRKWCQTTERSGWVPMKSAQVKPTASRREVCEEFGILLAR